MRNRAQQDDVRRWLAAEAADDERYAEQALVDVFASLPPPRLPASFADRVVARLAAEPRPWPLEQAALSLLLLCGLSLAAAPFWLPALWQRVQPAGWVEVAVDLLVRLAQGIATLAPLWEGVARVARWLALAGQSPQVLSLLAASGLLAATSARLLFAFLTEERSPGHVRT